MEPGIGHHPLSARRHFLTSPSLHFCLLPPQFPLRLNHPLFTSQPIQAMSQAEVTRAESIDDQRARDGDGDKKPKSRRPASAHPLPASDSSQTNIHLRYCVSPATIESLAVSFTLPLLHPFRDLDRERLLTSRLDPVRPILTPKSVLPLFFIIGILFAPIGGVMIWASSLVRGIVPSTVHLLARV